MFRVFANMACTRVTCFFGGVFFTSTVRIHGLLSLSSKLRLFLPAFEQCASYKMPILSTTGGTIRTQPYRGERLQRSWSRAQVEWNHKIDANRSESHATTFVEPKHITRLCRQACWVDRLLQIFVSTCAHRGEGRSVPLTSPLQIVDPCCIDRQFCYGILDMAGPSGSSGRPVQTAVNGVLGPNFDH